MFLLVWFSLEFAFRLWSCGYISRYQGIKGRLNFLMSLYMMIDIFVILSTAITLLMQVNGNSFATILRVTRFMQVFRILRVDRQRGDIRTMGNVVRKHCKELITVYFVGFVLMFSATYLVYLCEKHISQNDDKLREEVSINNMADGLYWAAITVTSVGYGDFAPVTWAGKLFCAFFALIGCAFFSLPAGILGTGFALQQKKEKRYIKVRNPAAYLIQTMWRNYALQKGNDKFEATWNFLLSKLRDNDEDDETEGLIPLLTEKFPNRLPSPPLKPRTRRFSLPKISKIRPDAETQVQKYQAAIQTPCSPVSNPLIHLEEGIKKIGKIVTKRNNNRADVLKKEDVMLPRKGYQKLSASPDKKSTFCRETIRLLHQNGNKESIQENIHRRYKTIYRFILKLHYRIAIKSFKSKRHPFVNMQDLMEKNAMSHVEMLANIKGMRETINNLQQELLELRYTMEEIREGQSTKKKKNVQRIKSFSESDLTQLNRQRKFCNAIN
eukprot:TCONS_00005099-protein